MNTTTEAQVGSFCASAPHTHDLCVFIGRFQPFHVAHLEVVREALRRGRHVLILIGSTHSARTHRNPFVYEERADMIRRSLDHKDRSRVSYMPLEDVPYNDTAWVKQVQQAVLDTLAFINHFGDYNHDNKPQRVAKTVALIGHSKDATSYYLKLFPTWDCIDVPNHFDGLSSTRIRNVYFSNAGEMFLANADGHRPGDLPRDHFLPTPVREFLTHFLDTPEYREIREEYEFITAYQLQWANTPYPVTFVTVDACVVQAGHILLVRRRARPGRGLWALPGGFIGQDETIEDAMLRELREETKIAVPIAVLRGSIQARRVFDDPHRSSRGRTITHGFLIQLRSEMSLPKLRGKKTKAEPPLPSVEGGDDADLAQWFPITEVHRYMMYEDHFAIIQAFTATI